MTALESMMAVFRLWGYARYAERAQLLGLTIVLVASLIQTFYEPAWPSLAYELAWTLLFAVLLGLNAWTTFLRITDTAAAERYFDLLPEGSPLPKLTNPDGGEVRYERGAGWQVRRKQ